MLKRTRSSGGSSAPVKSLEEERNEIIARNREKLAELGLDRPIVQKVAPALRPAPVSAKKRRQGAPAPAASLLPMRTTRSMGRSDGGADGGAGAPAARAPVEPPPESRWRVPLRGDIPFSKAVANTHRGDADDDGDAVWTPVPPAPAPKAALGWTADALGRLRVAEYAKVVPERIMSVALHPGLEPIVVCGDKYGHIGIWRPRASAAARASTAATAAIASSPTPKPAPAKIASPYAPTIATSDDDGESADPPASSPSFFFKTHTAPVYALQFDRAGRQLFSASYDGSVRVFDMERGVSSECFVNSSGEGIYGVVLVDDGGQTFAAADGGGVISLVDRRAGAGQVASMNAHGGYKIGGLDAAAADAAGGGLFFLASASNDHTVKLWDSRKLRASAALGTYEHARVAQSVRFSATMPGTLTSSSVDDTICIWHNAPARGLSRPSVTIVHNNQTGRWTTNFKVETSPSGRFLMIGGMDRALDIYNLDDGKPRAKIGEARGITAIPAVNAFHREALVVASGNSSGRCALFSSST